MLQATNLPLCTLLKLYFPLPGLFKKILWYTKHQGAAVQMDVTEMIDVDSYFMCAGKCVGKPDCSFTVEEDERGFKCKLMKEGSGVLMKNFFTLDY